MPKTKNESSIKVNLHFDKKGESFQKIMESNIAAQPFNASEARPER